MAKPITVRFDKESWMKLKLLFPKDPSKTITRIITEVSYPKLEEIMNAKIIPKK